MPAVKIITPQQAKRGIYIDFESVGRSNKNKLPEPHMLGAWGEGMKKVFLFRSDHGPFTKSTSRSSWKSIELSSMDEAISSLNKICESEKRIMNSYSIHELNVVKKYCKPETVANFKTHYVNAKRVIEYWRNKCHGGKKPRGNSLKGYFEMYGYENETELGFSVPGVLRAMDKEMEKTKRWKNVSDAVKEDWLKLLVYNWHDCKGLFRLTKKAANAVKAKKRDST